jgi:hypothetical protein
MGPGRSIEFGSYRLRAGNLTVEDATRLDPTLQRRVEPEPTPRKLFRKTGGRRSLFGVELAF